jgi:hypothetical protein
MVQNYFWYFHTSGRISYNVLTQLMKQVCLIIFLLGLESALVPAQSITPEAAFPVAPSAFAGSVSGMFPRSRVPVPQISLEVTPPRMAPQLALEVCQSRMLRQKEVLASSYSTTTVRAELPQTSQKGEFELHRHYAAPKTLEFSAIHFTGDKFVKGNVITRVLQSEVDHVQKDSPALTALSSENYKFSYRGTTENGERLVHVFQVKPRHKRVGLFKGHIFVDAYTGSLVGAEGRFVKSPSFFLSKIDFVQEYTDVDGFTVPTHIHSEAKTRLVGRVVVDIVERDYRLLPAAGEQMARGTSSLLLVTGEN